MEKVRIQDDLYLYVNQEKIEELVIPDDMPTTGGFSTLNTEVEKLMMSEFNEMCEKESFKNDYLKRACALYKAARNVEKKNADGIARRRHNRFAICGPQRRRDRRRPYFCGQLHSKSGNGQSSIRIGQPRRQIDSQCADAFRF